jgi:hypothetical protein
MRSRPTAWNLVARIIAVGVLNAFVAPVARGPADRPGVTVLTDSALVAAAEVDDVPGKQRRHRVRDGAGRPADSR